VLFYVPGLPEETRRGFAGNMFASAEAAVAGLASQLPVNAKIAVIPEGPYVLAKLQEPALV